MNDKTENSRPNKPAQVNLKLSNDDYLFFSAIGEKFNKTKHALFLEWLHSALPEAELTLETIPGDLSKEGRARLAMASIQKATKNCHIDLHLDELEKVDEDRRFKTVDGVLELREELIDRIQMLTKLLCELSASEMSKLHHLRKIDVKYVASLPSEYRPVRDIAKFHEDKKGLGPLEELRVQSMRSEVLVHEVLRALDDNTLAKFTLALQSLRKNSE